MDLLLIGPHYGSLKPSVILSYLCSVQSPFNYNPLNQLNTGEDYDECGPKVTSKDDVKDVAVLEWEDDPNVAPFSMIFIVIRIYTLY